MKKNVFLLSLSVFVSAAVPAADEAAAAVPEVRNLSVAQTKDRVVNISFELTHKAIVTMDITTNGVSIGAENYQTLREPLSPKDEFPANKVMDAGEHAWMWRPSKEWPGHNFMNGEFKVTVQAWSFDAPPPYMIVDYTIKSNITFYAAAEDIPGGIKEVDTEENPLSNDVYRLSKIILRKIPAAGVKWRMGSPESETYRRDDETPHYVTLTNDYYVAIYPLTFAQCKRFFQTADDNKVYTWITPKNNQSYTGSRGEIESYCYPNDGHAVKPTSGFGYMRARTGLRFDFLTEAEWEYACRAGTEDEWNGKTEDEVCWHGLTSAAASNPVGTKLPNAWGLYDMHGLVNEWVLDQYGEYPEAPVVSPVGVDTNPNKRVLRGGVINLRDSGGRYLSAISTRSAFRHSFDPTQKQTTAPNPFGVRVSCPASLPSG
jgi:formylglycine-generating enzyme required for sulfatase activity